jgi:Disulphide bond corrector protein DsbC/AhpC/TSA family
VELQRSLPDFERQHIAIFAISYDSVDALQGFADKFGITYALLSDEGSQVIRELGVLNDRVDEQHAAYGIARQDRHRGLPYPGVFLLDAQGRVMQKRFQQSYRERETGAGILAQGFGATSSVHGPEAHGQSEGVKVRASLDSETYRFFQRLWLTVELTIEPGVHVYARPIAEGYIPLSVDVAPIAGMIMGTPAWPTPQPCRVEGLDEEFFAYEGQLRLTLPVTLTEEGDDQMLEVIVRYQACRATDCFLPSTVRLELPLKAADHVERPRRQ